MSGRAAPVVVSSREDLSAALGSVRMAGGRIALVPTMGALHIGHARLMAQARRRISGSDVLVASIFVNPLQFGPDEDLERYPRTFDDDLAVCAAEGVAVVFAPSVEEVFPGGEAQVTVDPGPLGMILEGAVRPTHFRGVLTVLAKLFGLVGPDLAVFGEKDYQQLVLIRRMVADLCLPVEVVATPTVREADGLALSSRNTFLTPQDRVTALALPGALLAAVDAGARGPDAAVAAAVEVLRPVPGVDLDYLEVTGPDLGPVTEPGAARVLIAAGVGSTRLIDNMALRLGNGPGGGPA
ncbi:MAG: pantoate--beta-alanine ligase [Nocardioidaceae bacterium]|nr:pantoate--beta-alanine ligase [Nocardioidaceae bacterium]